MQKQPAIAELRFSQHGLSLYGTVMQMSAQDVTVRLHTVPTSHDLFAPDNRVELVVVARETMFTASTEISAFNNGTLRLLFCAPARSVQQRKEDRISIDLGITFRPIQDNGCFGLWKSGFSKDLSLGGMRLQLGPGLTIASKAELLFVLPTFSLEQHQYSALSGADGFDLQKGSGEDRGAPPLQTPTRVRPLKATARVSNRRALADGGSVLGLSFLSISPADQIRLARFLSAKGLYAR